MNLKDFILQHTAGNLYWKDTQGLYLGCNQTYADMIGLASPEEIVGKSDADLYLKQLGKDQIEKIKKIDQEVIRTGQEKTLEETGVDNKGNISYYITRKIPLTKDDEIVGLMGTSIEITNLKETEIALREAKEKAEHASQVKSEFIANMSHDIRTPLSGLIGASEILDHQNRDKRLNEEIHDITLAAKSLLALLNEIIEITQLDLGEMPEFERPFSLRQLIQKMKDLLLPTIKQKKLKFKLEIDDHIPDRVHGNDILLSRVLLNLLGNALKFTDQGHVYFTITLQQQDQDNVLIQFSIEDTGPGIAKEQQEIIFEAFRRLSPSYEGTHKGTGLGLYIVKKYLDTLQGSVSLDSAPGKGSIFACQIPLTLTEEEPITDNKIEAVASLALSNEMVNDNSEDVIAMSAFDPVIHPHNAPHILIVEDNALAAKVALFKLRKLEYRVELAKSGEQAYKLATEKDFDLIYMDVGLPGMDGCETTQKIRQWEQTHKRAAVPIIALTAHISGKGKKRCQETGINDVITKPISDNQVLGHVNQYVQSTKAHKEHDMVDWDYAVDVTGSREVAQEMLAMFVKTLPEELTSMQEACNKKDWGDLFRKVHKLHGAARYCGVHRIVDSADALECILQVKNKPHAADAFATLEDEIKALIKDYPNV